MVIVSSALLRITASDYPFGILWSLCRLLFLDLRLVITPLVFVVIVSSALLGFTASDYPFGILWSLCRLLFLDLRLVITPLVSSNFSK